MNKRFAIIDKMYDYIQELEENDIPDTFWREKFKYFLTNEMNTLSVPDALALLDERMSEVSADYLTAK